MKLETYISKQELPFLKKAFKETNVVFEQTLVVKEVETGVFECTFTYERGIQAYQLGRTFERLMRLAKI